MQAASLIEKSTRRNRIAIWIILVLFGGGSKAYAENVALPETARDESALISPAPPGVATHETAVASEPVTTDDTSVEKQEGTTPSAPSTATTTDQSITVDKPLPAVNPSARQLGVNVPEPSAASSIVIQSEKDIMGDEQNEEESGSWLDNFKISGYLKNELAYRVHEPRSFTKIRNIIYLNAQYPFNAKAKLNYSGWAYYDLVYDLFDYDTVAARFERNIEEPLAYIVNLEKEKDSPVAQTREMYLDLYLGKTDIRLGKQYIIWGVLEGVRVVDEINPMDFRELILPDLLDYRIPLWSVKLDLYREEASYEFIWIPEIQPHKPAPPGSEWELLQEVPGTKYPESMDLGNSEVGFKVGTNLWDTELSFSYFYTWDDFPTIFRWVRINRMLDPIFMPTYTRIGVYGATFTKQIGDYILKGELAYVQDKYFAVVDKDINKDGTLDDFGEVKKDHIRWGLGVDFNVAGIEMSPSIVQWIILDYDEYMVQDAVDTGINFFMRKEIPQRSAVFQMLGIYLVNFREYYLKPKLMFHLTDHFQVGVGLDLFWGDKSQFGVTVDGGEVVERTQQAHFLGNFNDNDRIFTEFKYSF